MNNKKGSILVLVLTFILIFTMLGLTSIHYAGLQNEDSEKRAASAQAFWYADGAIEYAKTKIQNLILTY